MTYNAKCEDCDKPVAMPVGGYTCVCGACICNDCWEAHCDAHEEDEHWDEGA